MLCDCMIIVDALMCVSAGKAGADLLTGSLCVSSSAGITTQTVFVKCTLI